MRQTFKAVLVHPDATGAWTYLTVPFDVERAYGTKARVAVKDTVDGADFRSSLLPQGDGTHILVVPKPLRTAAKAGSGDTVEVVVESDTAPRTVEVPQDLSAALALHPDANARFEAMSYSHKKEYVDWIESAKRAETRAARVQKAVGMIAERLRLKG